MRACMVALASTAMVSTAECVEGEAECVEREAACMERYGLYSYGLYR